MTIELAFARIYDQQAQGLTFSGTAFFIKANQLLTAKHVVNACTQQVLLKLSQQPQAIPIKPERIEKFEGLDLATIYLKEPITHIYCLPLASSPLQNLQEVVLHGFPDETFELNNRKTHLSSYMNDQYGWVIADGVRKGMSGGAVLRNGELVGVIYARDEDSKVVTYCIPIEQIRACLGEIPLDTLPNQDQTDLQRAETVFVGRIAELAQLKAALCQTEQTPIAITAVKGMAGVGKSWLADHFYATHRDQFAGGYERFSLNVESLPSSDLLLGELADRLHLAAPKAQLPALLAQRLHQPRTLIHIENVDSDAAARVVAQFCQFLPDCAIILSGRLENFGGHRQWRQITLKPFVHAEAIAQLQSELAWLGQEPLPENEALQLVKALGGLPLAIHLAAGYLATGYSLKQYLRELEATGFTLPPADATDDVFTRDQARAVLHSTFQISLKLLNELAQPLKIAQADQLFARLGYAPSAGFNQSMATTLMDLDADTTESLMSRMQKLSLIDQLQPKPPRWQLHPLLAQYLRQHAPEAESIERLNQWFLTRLPEPDNQDTKNEAWHELNQEQAALAEWLASVPSELHSLVERTGSRYAIRNGPFLAWSEMLQTALQNSALEEEQRSNLLFTLTKVAQSSGDIELALQSAEQKQALDEQRGDEREAILAKGQIADILQARGQLDEALRIRTQDQLPVYERLGEVRSIAITKGQIADILQARGQLDEALRIRTQDQLPVYERLGEVREIAITQGKIADILQARGQLDEALRIRQHEELPVYERLGDVREIAITQGKIADILQARGQLDEALRIRQHEELPVYERLGDVREIAITQGKIADILQARGQLDEALRIRQHEELPVYERLGDVREIAITQGKIADILQARGQLDEALRIRQHEELPVYERLGEVREIAITKGQIADILQARGQLDEALRIRQHEELPVYERLGDVREIAITKGKIANIYFQQNRKNEALTIYEAILPIYEQLGDKLALLVAQANLALMYLQTSEHLERAKQLLHSALKAAQEMQIPEAGQIEEVLRQIAD